MRQAADAPEAKLVIFLKKVATATGAELRVEKVQGIAEDVLEQGHGCDDDGSGKYKKRVVGNGRVPGGKISIFEGIFPTCNLLPAT
jgi:hypothetical protein